MGGANTKLKNNTNDSKHSNSSSSTARSANEKKDSKKEDAKSTAVTRYEGPALGEACPPDSGGLSNSLWKITESYLGGDVGDEKTEYSPEDLSSFKLWGKPMAIVKQIGTLILTGQRTKALALIQKHPASLECFTQACDPRNRLAGGEPLRLAAAAGDRYLVTAIRNLKAADGKTLLLPKEKADTQLAEQFSDGWLAEQKERNQREVEAATHYRDRLAEKRLPANCPPAEALKERWDILIEYRNLLTPKPNDLVLRGLLSDPQVCLDVRQLFLDSEATLGGWQSPESRLLWVGYQSSLGNGSAILAQTLIKGANKYSDEAPAEDLILKNGDPFFTNDPASGIGASIVLSFFDGNIHALGWQAGQWGSVTADDKVAFFWKTYVEQLHQHCRAYTASGPAINNDAGAIEFRRSP
jgi:hypothetical protein